MVIPGEVGYEEKDCYINFFFFFFLWPLLQHTEVPRLGAPLVLQLPAYSTATATPD